jgi:hypothetical protein
MSFLLYASAMLLLTVLTQVGGLVLLLCLPLFSLIQLESFWLQTLLRGGLFLLVYLLAVLVVVPKLASWGGRVPLPCVATADEPLQPANLGYCLLLRNYVTPETRSHLLRVAQQFRDVYPGSRVRYLDANFPFLNGFPLLPHLSHKDGRKVDLAFFYQRKDTQMPVDFSPSWLGYWFYEQPQHPKQAACQGQANGLRWDFDGLQARYAAYAIDEGRTRVLLQLLVADAQKVLLEPHLQQRLGVEASNLKFQGCHAARHDDHIHAQW